MDELEVDIDDKGDALEQLVETRLDGDSIDGPEEPTSPPTKSRKRRISPSFDRLGDNRNSRDNRRDKNPRNRQDTNRDSPLRQKYRRTYTRLDQRAPFPPNFRMPILPPLNPQPAWNSEVARAKRWDTSIITLLDKFEFAKECINSLADLLSSIGDSSKPAFSSFEKSVEAFPIKTGAYASVVGLLKAKGKINLAEQMTQRLMHNLGSCISSGNRIGAIHLLRFLIGLHSSNVKSCRVLEIIEYLINAAKTLEGSNYEMQEEYFTATLAADNLMYIVVASIPWFSRDEFLKSKEIIKGFCSEVIDYNDRRNHKLAAVKNDIQLTLMSDSVEKETIKNPYMYIAAYREIRSVMEFSDRLTTSVECIKSLLNSEWISTTTYRFYQSKGIKDNIFHVGVTAPVSKDIAKVTDEIFHAITNIDIKQLKAFKPVPMHNLTLTQEYNIDDITIHDKWLLQEHVLHTVHAFKDDTALCAKQLLMLPHNSAYREYAIVEVLFNVMLSPIYNRHFTMLAVLVMQEMCNVEPRIEVIFLESYSKLVNIIPQLDTDVVCNMLNIGSYWFAVEFCKLRKDRPSQNQDDTDKVTENRSMDVEDVMDATEEMKEMIREKNAKLFSVMFKQDDSIVNFNNRLLDKISRLVYVDRLLAYSPEDLKDNIKTVIQPPIPSVQHALRDKPLEHKVFLNLLHFNKLNSEENDLRNSRIIGFINKFVNKEPLAEMPRNLFAEDKTADVEMTDETNAGPEGNEMHNNISKRWMQYQLILIFWETLLVFGNKSLTHLMRLIELHGDVLKHFVSHEKNVQFEDSTMFKILRLTHDTLRSNPKKFELVVDALLRMEILQPVEACKFVFVYFPTSDFFSNHSLWILDTAVNFVKDRLENARNRFNDDVGKSDIMRATLEERETDMNNLVICLMECINNRLAQGLTTELEEILENILKNIFILNVHSCAILKPLLEAVVRKGFHRRIIGVLNLAMLSQSVKPLF
ncbi:hypothetical protein X943_002069 [Babesia divergens]|uniref:MIF4G-like type 2 domain-containing protein n=1 Tax=Babesia divergens TaxID=32595 RepID=A0AAD9GAF7_BABDI|nr:hypothetical protein X943_002069 [Babesia divergens]